MKKVEDIKDIIDKSNDISIEQLENEIDKKLSKSFLTYDNYIEVILCKEYSKQLRDSIVNKYIKEGGFLKVEHSTSSENGERAGLTNFKFYFK